MFIEASPHPTFNTTLIHAHLARFRVSYTVSQPDGSTWRIDGAEVHV